MLAILSFLFFTGLVAVLSWLYTRHDHLDTSTGYFLAGRSLTWIVIGGSLLLTNLSTEQLVGLNGGAFKNGMEIMAWELGASLAMVVMALVCMPMYLRGGITTVPEFLEHRYSHLTRGLISLMILVAVSVSVLPFVLYSGALFMRDVFEIPTLLGISDAAGLWLMVVSIGVVGSIYAIFGGLRAVAISDTLNGVGLLLAGLMIPLLGLAALGEGNVLAGFQRLGDQHVDRLDPFGDAGSELPASTLLTGVALLHLYYWCTNQFIVQRTFGARSLSQGQKGILFAASMKLLGPFYLILPGVIAFHLFRDQIDADGNLAYSTLVRNLLPKPLLGFFAAAIFGAILSSFNSALNSCATLFSVDLFKGFLHRQATDHDMVRVGKIFGTVLAIVVIAAAPAIEGKGAVFNLMKQVAATFDVPLMAIVFVGILSRRTPAIAAWAAVLVGVTFYATVTFVYENILFGRVIHWLHVAGLNFALMMVVMAAFRLIAPLPTPFQQQHTQQVDITPWRGAKPASVVILVAVVSIYLGLFLMSRR
jgi:solute:Na+ symporter, SSS family